MKLKNVHKIMNYWSKMTMCMCLMHVFMVFFLHSLAYFIQEVWRLLLTTKQKQLVIIIVTAVCTLLYKIFIVNPQKSCTMSIQKIIANKSMWMGDGVSLLYAYTIKWIFTTNGSHDDDDVDDDYKRAQFFIV